jgi:hypothetical protein
MTILKSGIHRVRSRIKSTSAHAITHLFNSVLKQWTTGLVEVTSRRNQARQGYDFPEWALSNPDMY